MVQMWGKKRQQRENERNCLEQCKTVLLFTALVRQKTKCKIKAELEPPVRQKT